MRLLQGFILCGALLLLASAPALAAFPPIDLTAGQTDVVSGVDGSIWSSLITQPTGTGVYKPFVRIQAAENEEGFNTDYKPFPLDDKNPSNFTHSVTWGSLATITIGSTDYYSFQLDANENHDKTEGLISLDKLKIYNSTIPNDATLAGLGNPLYDLDGTVDQTVFINTDLKPGSGTDDMTVYIPKSYFANVNANDYMVFYSAFGNSGLDPGLSTAATFEEWRAVQGPGTPSVPEPMTMVLLGSGLLGMAGIRRQKESFFNTKDPQAVAASHSAFLFALFPPRPRGVLWAGGGPPGLPRAA